MNETAFTLDDVTADSPLGDAARQHLLNSIREGALDPAIALQLSRVCIDRNMPGLGLWFMGATLSLSEEHLSHVIEQTPEPAASLMLMAGEEDVDEDWVSKGTSLFIPALETLSDVPYGLILQAIIDKTCADELHAELLLVLDRCEVPADSKTYLGLLTMSHLFQNDVENARETAARLEEVDTESEWILRVLSKLALIGGDFDKAQSLYETFLETRVGVLQTIMELATIYYCQNQKDKAQATLSRAFSYVAREAIEMRQNQIHPWTLQLEEAISNKTIDGAGMNQIGSAIHYTDEERVRAFWEQHHANCIPEKSFQAISAYTNRVMFERVENLMNEQPELRKIINYGTLCGVLEEGLARQHPDHVWAGYDISSLATEMNNDDFHHDNLVFSSDLNGLLSDLTEMEGKSILTHCRTADVMFPEAVRNIYRSCHEHEVDLILSAEYFSYSLPTLQFPDFDNDDIDTAHMDGIVVMHNYNRLFPQTGYRILSSDFAPVPLMVSATGEGKFGDQMIHFVLAERLS